MLFLVFGFASCRHHGEGHDQLKDNASAMNLLSSYRSCGAMLAIYAIITGVPVSFAFAAEHFMPSVLNSSLFLENRPVEQAPYNPLSGPAYPVMPDDYFTDDYGNILMIVNVLGEVNKPGQIVLRENADFSTLLAQAGGIKSTANMKKVVVSRREPDRDGAQIYKLNLKDYYKDGDRSQFIVLKPNDTVIVPKKNSKISGISIAGFGVSTSD